MSALENAPVIIRRKKVIKGDGHHGGAWKVAYADFVTAMMAFFLLMWLLGATNDNQRKGIADYFNPTIPVNRVSGGGEGAFGGESVFSEESLAQNGTGAGTGRPTESRQARGETGFTIVEQDETNRGDKDGQDATRDDEFDDVQALLQGRGGESMVTELLARHVISRLTDEGLIVEIFDGPGAPLFDHATYEPTETLEVLTEAIGGVFATVTNDVAIQGHVAASALVVVNNPSWELSQARADMVRKLFDGSALKSDRIARVSSFADRKPASDNPMSVRNNRIELILLRRKF